MEIKSERIILELNNGEAWDLAYHIKNSLQSSIESHYCSTHHDNYKRGYEGHAKPLFIEHCSKDMEMMKRLVCCARGESDYIEKDIWYFFEKTYKEKNGGLELKTDKEN